MATAYEHLSQQMETTLADFNSPGMLAVIVRKGGNETVASVRGVRKKDLSSSGNNKIHDNDRFCLGSTSKPVSGFMLSYLVQQLGSVFNFDKKIKDIFPELADPACQKHFNIRTDYLNATVAKMMTHTAYFPWAPTNSMDYTLDLAGLKETLDADYVAEYANLKALRQRRYNYMIASQQDAPVTTFTYNGGPILPVTMAERITGKAYEEMIKEYVFNPLGMDKAGVGRLATNGTPDGTWEHTYNKDTKIFSPATKNTLMVYNFHSHAPAGAVYFTYGDAIKFITEFFLKNGKTKKVVKDPLLTDILLPHANGFAKSGWIAGGSGDGAWISHDGDNGASYCRMTIYPNKGEGFIVCSNGSGWDGTYDSAGNGVSIGGRIINPVAKEINTMLVNWKTNF